MRRKATPAELARLKAVRAMPERWMPVLGFKGYEISDFGRIRSYLRLGTKQKLWSEPRPIAVCPSNNGYLFVVLHGEGGRKRRYVHRLVLEAFVGPCQEGMEACHNNREKADCRLENLRWDTRTANLRDKKKHGTQPMGETSHLAKLNEAQVAVIRAGGCSDREFARRLGVNPETVRQIRLRNTWRHVA